MNGDGDLSLDSLSRVVEDIELELGGDEENKNSREFLNLVWKKQSTEEELEKAFRVFDSDGDGFITSQDLESVLKVLRLWKSGLDSKRMITGYDRNSDGKIDLNEFKIMMNNNDQPPPTNLNLKVKF